MSTDTRRRPALTVRSNRVRGTLMLPALPDEAVRVVNRRSFTAGIPLLREATLGLAQK